jgi:hypothetical protein
MGVTHLQKPISKEELENAFDDNGLLGRDAQALLVVEDDEIHRMSIVELIGGNDVETTAVGTAQRRSRRSRGAVRYGSGPSAARYVRLRPDSKSAGRLVDNLPIIIYTGKSH